MSMHLQQTDKVTKSALLLGLLLAIIPTISGVALIA